jgi:hypothetical protein
MSIRPKKRDIKRYAFQKPPTPHHPKRLNDPEPADGECSETAIVRCNQWECFTRYVCK